MKNIIINILIVLITVILTLYLIELLLRSTAQASPFNGKCDREYIESLQNLENYGERNFNKDFKEPLFIETCPYPRNNLADAYQVTWGHVVKLNSEYFRWREFLKSNKEQVSIMILGDSLTFGVGMPLQKSYPFLVEKMLNNNEGNKFVVYSLALPGGTLDNHVGNIKQYIDELHPDLIVLALYHNDIESIKKSIEEKSIFENLILSTLNFMKLVNLKSISEASSSALYKIKILKNWEDYRTEAYLNKDSWHWLNLSNNLKEIIQISDNRGIKRPIINSLIGGYGRRIMDLNNPPEGYKIWQKWQNEIEEEGCRLGYYVYNNDEEMRQNLNNKSLAVNEWDYHPSEELHFVYATNLKKHILNVLNGSQSKFCM